VLTRTFAGFVAVNGVSLCRRSRAAPCNGRGSDFVVFLERGGRQRPTVSNLLTKFLSPRGGPASSYRAGFFFVFFFPDITADGAGEESARLGHLVPGLVTDLGGVFPHSHGAWRTCASRCSGPTRAARRARRLSGARPRVWLNRYKRAGGGLLFADSERPSACLSLAGNIAAVDAICRNERKARAG